MWTWEQFSRAAKFLVGLAWGTMELWQWGARPASLAFVATIIGVTEAGQLYVRLHQASQKTEERYG